MITRMFLNLRSGLERGYTLLEYCVGAAIIASVLWLALNSLGDELSNLLTSVGGWARKEATEVN